MSSIVIDTGNCGRKEGVARTAPAICTVTAEDFRNRAKRDIYLAAMQDMFAKTDTRWAPWKVFDGNNQKAARIAVLRYIADELEARIPADYPELDPDISKLAEEAFGNQAGEG